MPLRHRIVASVLVAALVMPAARGQLLLPNGGVEESGPRDPRQGVYVRDSAVAGEKLALAQRMERLKEWDKSADVYQEIVEKYADRVVPVAGGNERDGTKRYTSVTLAVQELLGKWPDEGLAAYRARYETPAATMLEAAAPEDAGALNRVVQTYFPTDAAKSAAMRLIELYIDTGEFAAAAWLGERLLSHHPNIEVERPNLRFRTALAQHLGGNDAAAKRNLEQIPAAATGMVMGRDVALADELRTMLAAAPAAPRGASADTWPMFGGDPTRGRIPDAAGRPGAKLVDIPITRPRQRPPANPQQRVQLDADARNRRDAGLGLCIMPVVDRGELFYQDNSRVYARGLESGLPLPGWTTTYADNSRQRYAGMAAMGLSSSTPLTVTVTDHSVLAVLGQGDRGAMRSEFEMMVVAERDAQLVCLDRTTGARRWSVSPSQFPASLANLQSLDMGGSPLVIGDNVYIAARGGKPMQFEDAYVLCFNLADGKLKWACYLASGNAPDGNMGGVQLLPTGISHLAFSGGRIYAVTNLGAVAAVDAYAGTIVWLSVYPRPGGMANMMNGFVVPQPGNVNSYNTLRKPWAQNPAIVKEGRVFALPTDARHILVYDAATGEEIKRIATADFEGADTLLGVEDDKLIVSGKNKVYCINWSNYDAKKKATDSLFWYGLVTIAGTEKANEDTVRGRGFVTTDSVFIPTTVALRRFSMKNGAIEQTYPPSGTWATGEGPGNVLVTSDQVILAGADSIGIYSDLALARAKLDRAVEATPADALPRLKYAEMLFAAGQIDPAVGKLDEAIGLLGGLRSMRPGPERDRVFARSLAFAEQSADPKAGASDPSRAAALYDRAAAAASSPPQQVAYRLSRARFARQQRDFLAEVRLLQEILSDGSFRAVPVPGDDGWGTAAAGSLAEQDIRNRVKDYPAAYREFESAAAAALEKARQAKDAGQMLAVAQVYPNAKVAPQAMLAAAEAYEAAGQHRPATQVLKQAYFKYKDSADKARILESQARNYLALPNSVEVAIGRLGEGAKIESPAGPPVLSRPLKIPGGETIENVSFAAAALLLQQHSARVATAGLADFHIPKRRKAFLPEEPQWVIEDVDQLLVPPRELRGRVRHDRVTTWTAGKGVSVFAVGKNQPLGTNSIVKTTPRGSAWVGDGLLVWTADTLYLLRHDGADLGWQVAVRSLPSVEVLEGDPAPRDEGPAGGGVVVAPGMVVIDNQIINLRRVRGQIIMPNGRIAGMPLPAGRARAGEASAEQIEHVRPIGDRVVLATSTGRIAVVDIAGGQLAWQTRVGDTPIDQLVANDDFVAVRFSDDYGTQIAALETFGGQKVWRRAFTPENALPPLNLTLSPDGTLLYTLPDRVCGKDLYEPGAALKFGEKSLSGDGSRMFDGAGGPDQLVVAEGRILAVADQGQFVRQISPDDGREIPGTNALATSSPPNDWNVWVRVVGPRVYVFNSRTVTSYNLDRLGETWTGLIAPPRGAPTVRNAWIGREHVVLLDQPGQQGGEPVASSPTFRLLAYGRYPGGPGRTDESGKLDQIADVTHRVGIDLDQWQPVDGGFYYRSVDRKAHFLKGAAE